MSAVAVATGRIEGLHLQMTFIKLRETVGEAKAEFVTHPANYEVCKRVFQHTTFTTALNEKVLLCDDLPSCDPGW